jgi:repressor LexA
MLTRKQHQLLLFIHDHLADRGVSPSFDEMKVALGLRSKSGIHRLITGLEERGFIRRLPHRARALEVLRLPEDLRAGPKPVPAAAEEIGRFQPRLVSDRGSAKKKSGIGTGFSGERTQGAAVALPLYGRIAAGLPIEALQDPDSYLDVPSSLLSSGEHYALEVEGDSMIEAGILDGDTVIIRRGDSAENGEIVVALVDDNEVTLKRLRRKSGAVALEPANRNLETRIFPPERVKIQGRLVGLLRSY